MTIPPSRRFFYKLLTNMPGIKPLAAAADGEQALQLVKRLSAEVALLAVVMPKLSGFEVAAEIRKLDRPTRVILVSTYQEVRLMEGAMAIEAAGYIAKCDLSGQLEAAIRSVSNGQTYFVLAS